MSGPSTGKFWAWTRAGHLVDVARHGMPKDAVLVCEEGRHCTWVTLQTGGKWVGPMPVDGPMFLDRSAAEPAAGGGPAGEGEGEKEVKGALG